MKKLLAALLLLPSIAFAQQPLVQSGSVTPGHVGIFVTNGIMADGGVPGGPIFTGSTTVNDFACVGMSGTIIDCGLSATSINNWPAQQNFNVGATAPTRAPGDSTTNVATTAFVQAASANILNTINTWPALQNFNGGATAPTRPPGDNTTNVATTAFVQASGPEVLLGLCSTSGAFPIYNATSAAWVCSTAGGTGSLATLNGAPLTVNASGYALQPTIAGQTSSIKLSGGQDSINQGETIAEFDTYGANAQGTILFNKSGGGCLCTGSISGSVLTISGVTFGSLALGQIVGVIGGSIPLNTTILSLGTGSGGIGTYNLSASGAASPGATIRTNDTPTNPTAVVNGEFLGVIESAGWYINGSTPTRTNQTSMVNFISDGGNFSSTSWPTSIQFLTTPVGATTPGNPTASGDILNPHQQFVIGAGGYVMEQLDNIAGGLSDGFIIRNTTPATAIAPVQDSPSIHLFGSGWKTNATAASQEVDGIITVAPAQGTSAPTGTIAFAMQVNGGGYVNKASISSGGVFNAATGYTLNGSAPSTHVLRGNGTNYVDGQVALATDVTGTLPVANGGTGQTTIPGILAALTPSRYIGGSAIAVNFNSANTDNAITIQLPTGVTAYQIVTLKIGNASASLSTSTWGLFSATGGGGTTIFAAAQANTVTTAAANTNNNSMLVSPANSATLAYNFATLQFRVGTAEGSPATGDVLIEIAPIY